jgi:hypothetical protein
MGKGYAEAGVIDNPAGCWQGCAMSEDATTAGAVLPAFMADEALALRAGPAPTSPPLIVAFMILVLGLVGPVVFVRDAVPSVFLTIASLLMPVAGVVAVVASVGSWRRRRADPAVRARAIIAPGGVTLVAQPGMREAYEWGEIAGAFVSRSVFTLHLSDADGKATRRAIRYSALETPVEMLEGRIAVAMHAKRESQP